MNKITKLIKKCVQTGGRNNYGVTTVFHRGGGNKKLYRIIGKCKYFGCSLI